MKFTPISPETMEKITNNYSVVYKKQSGPNGIKYRIYYANRYGVSLIKTDYSHGGDQELWEMAVLKDDKLCFDTHIASRTIGFLTEEDIISLCKKVCML